MAAAGLLDIPLGIPQQSAIMRPPSFLPPVVPPFHGQSHLFRPAGQQLSHLFAVLPVSPPAAGRHPVSAGHPVAGRHPASARHPAAGRHPASIRRPAGPSLSQALSPGERKFFPSQLVCTV